MEPVLGFQEDIINVDSEEISSSSGFRLVPWLNWKEWESVRESLFSHSTKKIAFALKRISTWRSRGCLPVVIDVTASIIEIQLKDPYYSCRDKEEQPTGVLHSEQLLSMLYCMAILRLVNCVVEKTRKKTEISIAEAANAIGIPRKLIDVRHEGSHRDLPALQVVRDSSDKALDWLKSYYWEPQKKQIPFQRERAAGIQRDIKSKLRELAFCLKVKQNPQLGSSTVRGKRGKNLEGLCGSSKFFSVMAGKLYSSRSGDSKKQMTKSLKSLVQLYSSFSAEVVSVILDFLLEALDSTDLGSQENCIVDQNIHGALDDWKTLITRFSKKEPELLPALLTAALEMIENQEAKKYENGIKDLSSSTEYTVGTHPTEQLSHLFGWLVRLLGGLGRHHRADTSGEVKIPLTKSSILSSVLMQLLRKCLLVSSTGNKQLMDSAVLLAQLVGNTYILQKLSKLSALYSSDTDRGEENTRVLNFKDLLIQQEESLLQAARKLESVKNLRSKSKGGNTNDCNVGHSNRWVVAKSWNSCPIGMLPSDLSASGRIPVLDGDYNNKTSPDVSQTKEGSELNQCSGKREASWDIQQLDNSSVKKMRDTIEGCESDEDDCSSFYDAKGRLMIGGVWKKVREEELRTIESGIRILV